MKNLKFRAWTGKKMLYLEDNDDLFFTGDESNKLMYRPISALLGDSNDYEWMQSTGLKDRNGKEIYCGDIVIKDKVKYKIKYNQLHCCFGLFINRNYQGGMIADCVDEDGNVSKEWCISELEVIGNIYENPDLIK